MKNKSKQYIQILLHPKVAGFESAKPVLCKSNSTYNLSQETK